MHGMVLLLAMAAMITADPATAQDSGRASTRQTLSMGSARQSYSVLHVNAVTGSDERGSGSAEQPYKTITQALRTAPATSTVILLAPGHYSQDSGEQFPLRLRPGITIQGKSGEARNTLIVGGGEVHVGGTTQNATIVTADRSGLANILVSNRNGSGIWISAGAPILRRVALVSNAVAGVWVAEGGPVIENSYFHGNQYGLTIQGEGHALIRGNYFEETGRAITVTSPATPTISNNRVARNQVGIALQNNARPLLEANALVGNKRNGVIEVESSATVASTSFTAPERPVEAPERPVDATVIGINEPENDRRDSAQALPTVLPRSEADTNDTTLAVSLPEQPIIEAPADIEEEPVAAASVLTEIADETIANNGITRNEERAVSAIASLRDQLSRESPAVVPAPAPVSTAAQERVATTHPVRLSAPDQAGSHATNGAEEPVLEAPVPTETAEGPIANAEGPIANAEGPIANAEGPIANAEGAIANNGIARSEERPVSAISLLREQLARERPAVALAPATVSTDEQDNAATTYQTPLSAPESAVPNAANEADITQTTADGGIPIAVIPASEPEITQNDSLSHGRQEGISKLLARLNSNLEPVASSSEETVAMSTPNAPTVASPASQRLPVPTAAIPSSGGAMHLTPPGTVALTQTFRYRVLVEMADAEDLEGLVPDAFRTRVGRRTFMQAGAYIDEAEAQERLEWLRENGIDGRVNLRN